MQRLIAVQTKMLQTVQEHPLPDEKRDIQKAHEIYHMCGTAAIAQLLARKRNAGEEAAACMGIIHDLGRILSGKQENHAADGYGPAKELLSSLRLFSEDEIEQIAAAVRDHSNKDDIGSPEEEIVKDADILNYYMFGLPVVKESHLRRLKTVLAEFGLDASSARLSSRTEGTG
jgi:uncharacterized protein